MTPLSPAGHAPEDLSRCTQGHAGRSNERLGYDPPEGRDDTTPFDTIMNECTCTHNSHADASLTDWHSLSAVDIARKLMI